MLNTFQDDFVQKIKKRKHTIFYKTACNNWMVIYKTKLYEKCEKDEKTSKEMFERRLHYYYLVIHYFYRLYYQETLQKHL